jgi:hypothetical protein
MLTTDEVRAALPAPHREIVDGLLAFAAADARFRFVELCCSAARGAADELSDLDLGLGGRLIAVANGVEYPAYGITSILDAPGDPAIPAEMGETTTLDHDRLTRATRVLVRRLEEASAAAGKRVSEPPDHRRLAAYAIERLAG